LTYGGFGSFVGAGAFSGSASLGFSAGAVSLLGSLMVITVYSELLQEQ
jgi:hypothetical protein